MSISTFSFVKDSDMSTRSQLLAVPARDKMLKLDIVRTKKEFKPRDVGSYTILARNDDGSPAANAEVSSGLSTKRSQHSGRDRRQHQA